MSGYIFSYETSYKPIYLSHNPVLLVLKLVTNLLNYLKKKKKGRLQKTKESISMLPTSFFFSWATDTCAQPQEQLSRPLMGISADTSCSTLPLSTCQSLFQDDQSLHSYLITLTLLSWCNGSSDQ